MAEQLLRFQNQLSAQQRALDEKLLAQEKTTQSHDKALMHASKVFGETLRSLQVTIRVGDDQTQAKWPLECLRGFGDGKGGVG
jgi:hypothetical protein